ncbi:hypothetical protein M9H77_26316 [Catharanthus roseus]|uniref:Uncharacterized protein n=1 Tax=Catharanthus roseus TaxID=4058 RepID=A0ACC0A9D0_CATRO|nr:hypothetical protein M9H77_26316 [Catharanthus roseus]
MILGMLNNWDDIGAINDTHISLVPKIIMLADPQNNEAIKKVLQDYTALLGKEGSGILRVLTLLFSTSNVSALIIKSSLSMMDSFLQGKYFRTGTFLSSSLGYRPSFLWCSLLDGRNLLSLVMGFPPKSLTLKELPLSSFHISRGLERKVAKLIDYNQCC